MNRLYLDQSELEKLSIAMERYGENAEDAINGILHDRGGQLIQDEIKRLMPESNRNWRGTRKGARQANSLRNLNENLAVTVRTTKQYQYLYFPNDGSTTNRHYGNQHFFLAGAEAARDDIVELCINELVGNFNK